MVEHEALEGDGDKAAAKAEKATDLKHCEQHAVATDDDVIDRADIR
jgi:hypothetical protein